MSVTARLKSLVGSGSVPTLTLASGTTTINLPDETNNVVLNATGSVTIGTVNAQASSGQQINHGRVVIFTIATGSSTITFTNNSGTTTRGQFDLKGSNISAVARDIIVMRQKGNGAWDLVSKATATTGMGATSATTFTASSTLAVTGASTFTGGITGGQATNVGTWQPIAATSGTDTACSNGTAYVGSVFIPANMSVVGIQYLIGSVGGTNKVVVSLHSSTGALLANSALAGVTVGTAANLQQIPFTAPYAAVGPGWYFVGLTFDGNTAKFRSVPAFCNAGSGVIGNGVTQTFGTAASFTAPTTFTADKVPVASLY